MRQEREPFVVTSTPFPEQTDLFLVSSVHLAYADRQYVQLDVRPRGDKPLTLTLTPERTLKLAQALFTEANALIRKCEERERELEEENRARAQEDAAWRTQVLEGNV